MELKYSAEEVIPLPTVKLFLTGHIKAGKTALRHALGKSECKSRNSLYERTESDKERTAGIEIENLEHDAFGSVVAYDLAGHCEYTTSHSVVIDCGNNSIFLILFDISGDLRQMKKQVCYWAAFIKAGRPKGSQPHVLLVATHYDKALVAGTSEKKLQCMYSCVFMELKTGYEKVFILRDEQFILNCLNSTSEGMNHLRKVVGHCCESIKRVSHIARYVLD